MPSITNPERDAKPAVAGVTGSAARKTAAGQAALVAAYPVDMVLVHEPRRRSTTLLLCLFLGWAGCHRFYVGKRTSGRIYLLTGGILGLGVVVDLVLIAAGVFTDRFGNPLE
jgi:hypothetical protein